MLPAREHIITQQGFPAGCTRHYVPAKIDDPYVLVSAVRASGARGLYGDQPGTMARSKT